MSYSFEPLTVPLAEEAQGPVIEPPRATGTAAPPPELLDASPPDLPELHRPVHRPQVDRSTSQVDDVEARLEDARAEAHRQGVEEGRRAEETRVKTAIEAVQSLVRRFEHADQRREEEARERIAALATAIAAQLVEREVRASPEVMSDLVRRAVAEFPVNDPLSVHLNPSDLALLSSGLSDDSGREHLTSGQSVRWIPDPSIRSGGCLVEGGERVVDARLSRTLERICRALTDA